MSDRDIVIWIPEDIGKRRRPVAGVAPSSAVEQLSPTLGSNHVETAARRVGRLERELIVEQLWKFWRDQIGRRLGDCEFDPWIAEVSMPAHLRHGHVVV